jgi:hypothetical protein
MMIVPTHSTASLSGIPIIIGSKTHKANAKTIPKLSGLTKSLSALPSPKQTQNKNCGKIENNEYKT